MGSLCLFIVFSQGRNIVKSAKQEPEGMTSAADMSTEWQGDLMHPLNPLTSVATATGEELSILKCTNHHELWLMKTPH